jgi:hypothetical protein
MAKVCLINGGRVGVADAIIALVRDGVGETAEAAPKKERTIASEAVSDVAICYQLRRTKKCARGGRYLPVCIKQIEDKDLYSIQSN